MTQRHHEETSPYRVQTPVSELLIRLRAAPLCPLSQSSQYTKLHGPPPVNFYTPTINRCSFKRLKGLQSSNWHGYLTSWLKNNEIPSFFIIWETSKTKMFRGQKCDIKVNWPTHPKMLQKQVKSRHFETMVKILLCVHYATHVGRCAWEYGSENWAPFESRRMDTFIKRHISLQQQKLNIIIFHHWTQLSASILHADAGERTQRRPFVRDELGCVFAG